jgi:hypothetical protein
MAGVIWNVWSGNRLLGVVNETSKAWAINSASMRWGRHHQRVRVVEATKDPYRLKTEVRAEMLAYPGRIQ